MTVKTEPVKRMFTELTLQQCIDLATKGYIAVEGENWFRKSKHQFLGDALKAFRDGEKLYGNKHMYFILSKYSQQ